MPKKTPKTKALDTLQKLVRLKAADEHGYCTCVSCGKIDKWSSFDGGHFIPKGHSSYWALREENVHPQCKGCNGFGMKHGTAMSRYTVWMQNMYGKDIVDDMETMKRTQVKFYKKDYEEMTKDWNEQIKFHLKRIGE